MKQIHIKAGTLVVLSGLPGSGKSSLRGNAVAPFQAPPNFIDTCWISSDNLRKTLLGTQLVVDDNGLFEDLPQDANPEVFSIMRSMVQTRLKRGLTVVVDACNPTDADRGDWVEIARELGAPVKVLILDTPLEVCLKENAVRGKFRVSERNIREMANPSAPPSKQTNAKGTLMPTTSPQGFMAESKYPHTIV